MLEAEYCRAWDFGTGAEWAAVFTDDGTFELSATSAVAPMTGSAAQRFEGTAALTVFRDAFSGSWTMLHQMHIPAVHVDGERASAVVWFDCPVIAVNAAAASMSREIGVYRVDYILSRRVGEWRTGWSTRSFVKPANSWVDRHSRPPERYAPPGPS